MSQAVRDEVDEKREDASSRRGMRMGGPTWMSCKGVRIGRATDLVALCAPWRVDDRDAVHVTVAHPQAERVLNAGDNLLLRRDDFGEGGLGQAVGHGLDMCLREPGSRRRVPVRREAEGEGA